jgi:hypothetical protein
MRSPERHTKSRADEQQAIGAGAGIQTVVVQQGDQVARFRSGDGREPDVVEAMKTDRRRAVFRLSGGDPNRIRFWARRANGEAWEAVVFEGRRKTCVNVTTPGTTIPGFSGITL